MGFPGLTFPEVPVSCLSLGGKVLGTDSFEGGDVWLLMGVHAEVEIDTLHRGLPVLVELDVAYLLGSPGSLLEGHVDQLRLLALPVSPDTELEEFPGFVDEHFVVEC